MDSLKEFGQNTQNWLPAVMQVGGTLLSAKGQSDAGSQHQAGMEYQAKQADVAAGQAQASAQRVAAERQHQAKLLQSRAMAVAGASGAGVTDPTVINIIGGIAGEGAYRSMVALYEGEDKARTMKMNAQAKRYEGQQYKKAGDVGGFSTLLSGAASLYGNYGGKGPGTGSSASSGSWVSGYDLID